MSKILGVSILSAAKYKIVFDKYYRDFNKTDNYASMLYSLSGMYKVMKNYGEVSFDGDTTYLYDHFKDKVENCENRLVDIFIVESTPYFTYNDVTLLSCKFSSLCDEEKLDYIVWMTRRAILDNFHNKDSNIKSLNGLHLTNECKKASYYVADLCSTLGIKNKIIKIPAAFSDEINLYNGNGFHYFVLVNLSDKEYIIDCTYRQFFRADNNNLDRLGVVGLSGCNPGVFMLLNRDRKNVALAILKNGWVLSTDDNFKHYLDGFTLSFRNGLYYDWLGQVDYTVGYSVYDYLEFLNEDDFITNYEPLFGLGKQTEPMKNKKLTFRNR